MKFVTGLKQYLIVNAGIVLTHLICAGWIENCSTSILAFDIAQFFPSLNHQILSLILNKVGFDSRVSQFFNNYLVGRKTKYFWNNFLSSYFDVNIGVRQGFAFSFILSALYLSLIFYVFEKRLRILKIPVSVLLFVDNGLFIAQNKSFHISNSTLFYSYHIISLFLEQFGLALYPRRACALT